MFAICMHFSDWFVDLGQFCFWADRLFIFSMHFYRLKKWTLTPFKIYPFARTQFYDWFVDFCNFVCIFTTDSSIFGRFWSILPPAAFPGVCPGGAHSVNMHTRCIWTLWLHTGCTVNMHTECVYQVSTLARQPPDPAQAVEKWPKRYMNFTNCHPSRLIRRFGSIFAICYAFLRRFGHVTNLV
jgi:hypothetical protein